MRITGKKCNQRLREKCTWARNALSLRGGTLKTWKNKKVFYQTCFPKKNKKTTTTKKKKREQFSWVNWSDKRGWNIYFNLHPPPPLPLLLCPAPRPFIVFRWGYVNTAKIIYHLSVIRIADRCNLQFCAKYKWRLSNISLCFTDKLGGGGVGEADILCIYLISPLVTLGKG